MPHAPLAAPEPALADASTTPLRLVPVAPDHIPDLARICHEAFSALHDRHAVPRDIPDVETGHLIIGMTATRPDYTGVAAILDGRIVGSNFLTFADEVAGVGPITVDPALQSKGIGRALMQWAVDEARRRGIRRTRLFQEALNTTSLSLYTDLGFDWRDSSALMQASPAPEDHPRVRPMTRADLPDVDRISRATFGHSRVNDAAVLLEAGLPAFILEAADARPAGYLIATLFGHAGALPTDAGDGTENLLALAAHAARQAPPPMARFICPLSRQDLFRAALARGHRTIKVLSSMSLGEYTPPPGPHFPSIQC